MNDDEGEIDSESNYFHTQSLSFPFLKHGFVK